MSNARWALLGHPMTLSLSLEEQLPLDVMHAGRTCRRIADAAASEFGLTEATALPLVYLSRIDESPRQADIAEAMGIERPSVAWLIDQLSTSGLVERRECPDDKRVKLIYLTDKGRRVASHIHKALVKERKKLLAGISRADLQAASRVMTQIARAGAAIETDNLETSP